MTGLLSISFWLGLELLKLIARSHIFLLIRCSLRKRKQYEIPNFPNQWSLSDVISQIVK